MYDVAKVNRSHHLTVPRSGGLPSGPVRISPTSQENPVRCYGPAVADRIESPSAESLLLLLYLQSLFLHLPDSCAFRRGKGCWQMKKVETGLLTAPLVARLTALGQISPDDAKSQTVSGSPRRRV